MQQIKLSIQEDQAIFLNDHKRQGYKDKSAMMREALTLLKKQRELQQLPNRLPPEVLSGAGQAGTGQHECHRSSPEDRFFSGVR